MCERILEVLYVWLGVGTRPGVLQLYSSTDTDAPLSSSSPSSPQVRHMLDSSDERYLLNKLYIDDFCVWLQRGAVEGSMAVFARELSRQTRRMRPCHAGLGLGALEYEMDHE